MPIVMINMGGEMIYILEQRAQMRWLQLRGFCVFVCGVMDALMAHRCRQIFASGFG